MTNLTRRLGLTALIVLAPAALAAQQASFTLDQVMSPPFPDELVAAPRGGAVAWVFNARGARNIWVAAPPDYRGKAVTSYAEDDGQELTDLRWAPDGRAIVYVRGGGPNGKGEYPNPHSLVTGVEQAVWLVAATGGTPRRLSEGHAPAVSPKGDRVAFVRHGQVWWTSLGDTSGQGEQLIHAPWSARWRRWPPRVPVGEGRLDAPVRGSGERRSGHAAHAGRVRGRARGREPGRRDGRVQLESG